MGGYTFSSEPLILKPRSCSAAATAPIAVPLMPRKWNFCGALLVTRLLYAETRIHTRDLPANHANQANFNVSPAISQQAFASIRVIRGLLLLKHLDRVPSLVRRRLFVLQ